VSRFLSDLIGPWWPEWQVRLTRVLARNRARIRVCVLLRRGAVRRAGAGYFSSVIAGSQPLDPLRETRRRVRRVLIALIGLLYVASVPWYRDPDVPLRIVFGLPDWVAVALACYAAAACLNAIAWLLTDPHDAAESTDPAEPAGSADSSGSAHAVPSSRPQDGPQ
jgi:hypothetical protein